MDDLQVPPALDQALDAFAVELKRGTSLTQLRASRAADVAAGDLDPAALPARQRALLLEARASLAMTDLAFTDSARLAHESAVAWRDADDHASELALYIAELAAQIGVLRDDTLSMVPLANKIEHLLTAIEAAGPIRRRRVEAVLSAGFAVLQVDRLDQARQYFDRALSLAGDDIERARAVGAQALHEQLAGNQARALELGDQSLRLARSVEDELQVATMLRFIVGLRGSDADQLADVLPMASEAVELCEEVGGAFLASTLRLRGLLLIGVGQAAEGCTDLERSIKLLRESTWQHTLPGEALTLAQTLIATGQQEVAARVLREQGDLLDRAEGDERAEIDIFRYSAAVAAEDYAAAAGYADSAAAILAAAHNTNAATVYQAAADAWTIAGDGDRSDAARQAAKRLSS